MRALRPSNFNHLHMTTLITRCEGLKSVREVPTVLGPLFPTLFGCGCFRLQKYRQQPQGLETRQSTRETHVTYFYIDKLPQKCSILLIIFTIYASLLHFLSAATSCILEGFPWLTVTTHSSMGSELHPSKRPDRFRTPAGRIWMWSQSSYGTLGFRRTQIWKRRYREIGFLISNLRMVNPVQPLDHSQGSVKLTSFSLTVKLLIWRLYSSTLWLACKTQIWRLSVPQWQQNESYKPALQTNISCHLQLCTRRSAFRYFTQKFCKHFSLIPGVIYAAPNLSTLPD